MNILALEFSSPCRSVAVLRKAVGSTHIKVASCVIDHGTKSLKPLNLVAQALEQAQLDRSAIERIVVGLGPGSYTGIRLSIAIAQGWKLAGGVTVVGISSIQALASQAQADGIKGKLYLAVDAQRDELYVTCYAVTAAECREIEPLKIISRQDTARLLEASETPSLIAGPEISRWFPEGKLLYPSAAVLGQLSVLLSDSVVDESLEPIYLRPTTFVKAPPPRIVPPIQTG